VPQRIEQRLGLEQAATAPGIERDRIRPRGNRAFVAPHQQFRAHAPRHLIAEAEHLGKLEAGVNMQQRKRNRRRVKRLLRQPQHHRRVLADGVKHHRPLELRGYLAQDMDAFRLEKAKVAEPRRSGNPRGRW
jgi:hypothetical protein